MLACLGDPFTDRDMPSAAGAEWETFKRERAEWERFKRERAEWERLKWERAEWKRF